MAIQGNIKVDAAEEEFRKQSRWLSFKSATWGAVGMATFFGALSTIAMGVVSIATGVPATVAGGIPTPSAALLGGALPLAALGGLLGFGAFATYLAQKDSTELRILQDEHAAQQQVKCMERSKSPTIQHEYEHNCRPDGKLWGDIIANENQSIYSLKR